MKAKLQPVVCACSWTGRLGSRSPCPGCGEDPTFRVTPVRLSALRLIARRAPNDLAVSIQPIMVRWLVDERHRLIEPCEPARPPDHEGLRTRRTMRRYRLSAAGERVVLAAQLADRTDVVRREIVAESVARHADLERVDPATKFGELSRQVTVPADRVTQPGYTPRIPTTTLRTDTPDSTK